ncbi:MAG: lysophospholipid acyltransferase family protein [Steroidobacterales bacterium]
MHLRELLVEARDLALHFALTALPTETCSNIGARLGLSVGRGGHPAAAERSRVVLSRLRPELGDGPPLEEALVTLWQNVGRTFAEYSVVQRILREGRVTFADPAQFDAVMGDQRPLILCLLHLGNWGIMSEAIARRWPGRVAAIALVDRKRAHKIISRRWRKWTETLVLEVHRNVWRPTVEHLKRPGGVLILAGDEQHAGRVLAPFLGRPPVTDGNLGRMVRLASATGARIMPVYCERLPGVRFKVHGLPPMEFNVDRRDEAAMLQAVLRLDAQIEPVVRRYLEQWYVAVELDLTR